MPEEISNFNILKNDEDNHQTQNNNLFHESSLNNDINSTENVKTNSKDTDSGNEPVKELINDIFGDSDEDEEDEHLIDIVSDDKEFNVELDYTNDLDEFKNLKNDKLISTNNNNDDIDFLLSRNKKYRNQRRRMNSDILDNRDNFASKIIRSMLEAANSDRKLNEQGKPCFGKLNMLPKVCTELLRPELAESLIEHGLFQAFTAWLQPLPNGSLPTLEIRSKILQLIRVLPTPSTDDLKISGLGKIMMLLSRHPSETATNKKITNELIDKWIRPIYGLNESHESYAKNRAQRATIPSDSSYQASSKKSISTKSNDTDTDRQPKPGDKKFVLRARVPQPSGREYKVRPVSAVPKATSTLNYHMKRAEYTTKFFKRCIRKNSSKNNHQSTKVHKLDINGGKHKY